MGLTIHSNMVPGIMVCMMYEAESVPKIPVLNFLSREKPEMKLFFNSINYHDVLEILVFIFYSCTLVIRGEKYKIRSIC